MSTYNLKNMAYESCSIITGQKYWCLALQSPEFDPRGEIHVYYGTLKCNLDASKRKIRCTELIS